MAVRLGFDLLILKKIKKTLMCILFLIGQGSFYGISWSQTPSTIAQEIIPNTIISNLEVNGNLRIEDSTIESYLLINIGDIYTEQLSDATLKRLYNTGLFSDVDVGRRAETLVITVLENPILNRILFEGNKYKDDQDLYEEIQLRPRTVFSRSKVSADVQRVLEIYRRGGRFAANIEPKVIQKEQNRVDLVFEISEGAKSVIGKINFLGNKVFDNNILRTKIVSQESRWWNFLASEDTYDPDRLNFDQQKLRDFYREQGYADFRVTSAVAELSPNKQFFFINISVEEGQLYSFGNVSIESEIDELSPELLTRALFTVEGDQYDSSAIDNTVDMLTDIAGLRGYAFVDIRPQVKRNRVDRTVDIIYVINEAPRVYVEEIKILDNVRTHDRVLRREMLMVEGDAFNTLKVRRSEIRLGALQFFKEVEIEQIEGTTADKTILEITVEEQPTGELSAGLGYSSYEGLMINFSIAERNLLGKGQYARIGAQVSKRRKEIELGFTEPYFLNRRMAVGADLFLRDTNFVESGFRQKSIGTTLRTAFPLTEYIVMQLKYSLIQDNVVTSFFTDSPYIKDSSGDFLTSSVGFGLSYNSLDNPQKPTKGQLITMNQEIAGAGGNEKFIKTLAKYDLYIPVYKTWVFNVAAEVGHIEGLSGNIRLNRRFFIGNPRMRGFKEAGLGPREWKAGNTNLFTGYSLGGNTFYNAKAELFIPLGGGARDLGIEASAYVDVGALFNIDAEDSLTSDTGVVYNMLGNTMKPRVSVGIGFSWASPFGPFRIDLAKALRSQPSDETEFFQFNVGT
ncbi:MAG: outer membrane protein assembly factor BamA, partial [Kordiimonadaceae bacterium]|nr:outer membrane protein assembly factor BamA [Kordiimonadaceae bacterium]